MDPTPDQIALWFHYEEIAMHFNELILQYRLQLMGGAGAIGAISSYLIGHNVTDPAQRNWLRLLVSGGLLVLLTAAAALDLLYYNKLLQGAVDALVQYEAMHPGINMSTLIEKRVSDRGERVIQFIYLLILLPLLAFVLWSACQHCRTRRRQTS